MKSRFFQILRSQSTKILKKERKKNEIRPKCLNCVRFNDNRNLRVFELFTSLVGRMGQRLPADVRWKRRSGGVGGSSNGGEQHEAEQELAFLTIVTSCSEWQLRIIKAPKLMWRSLRNDSETTAKWMGWMEPTTRDPNWGTKAIRCQRKWKMLWNRPEKLLLLRFRLLLRTTTRC